MWIVVARLPRGQIAKRSIMQIDLNADLGDGAGFDAELILRVTAANICCQLHAGEPGEHQRGAVVTMGGSLWLCFRATTAKPGAGDDWRLIVKRGADGKDAVP